MILNIPRGYEELDRTKEPADNNCLFRDTDGKWKPCKGMVYACVLNKHLPIVKPKQRIKDNPLVPMVTHGQFEQLKKMMPELKERR